MSTAKAITYRHLESQLDETERITFITKLAQQSSNAITDALFLYFMHSANGESENENVNKLLGNIIASRKKEQTTDDSHETKPIFKIDYIPKQLIGEIASYMQQKDYVNFSKTNRSVYLGCNTPNKMQKLDLSGVNNYSAINLSLYRSVKVLKFKLRKFKYLKFPSNGVMVMNQLQTLQICGKGIKDFVVDGFIAEFTKRVNVENVSTLRLQLFGSADIGNRFDIDQFYKLLSTFPNVKCLNMYYVYLNGQFDVTKMHPQLHKLGTMSTETATINPLIGHYYSNLSHLMVLPMEDNNGLPFAVMNPSNLQRLDFIARNTNDINNIVKTATNLKRICILYGFCFNVRNLSAVKHGLAYMLKTCKALNFLDLTGHGGDLLPIFEGLETGLFATKKLRRKEMRIIIRGCSIRSIREVIIKAACIIHWLQAIVDDFMLMFTVSQRRINNQTACELKKEIQSVSSKIKVSYHHDLHLLVIANNSCRIDGFHSLKGPCDSII